MRDELKQYNGEELELTGFFHRLGYIGGDALSLLIEKVSLDGRVITEHVWVPYSEELKELDINSGDSILFNATVARYEKKEGVDYGLSNINNIRILSKSGKEVKVGDIKYNKFTVAKRSLAWSSIKGTKKRFTHNKNLEVQPDITISVGDTIEIELVKIKEAGYMEFAWKASSHRRWNKGAFFNPVRYGQAIVIYGFYQIFIPEEIYFQMKDFYFKTFFTKTEISLPYQNDMVHYVKPVKFKHRAFTQFDSAGNRITDELIINKREDICSTIDNIISNLDDNSVRDIIESVYGPNAQILDYYKSSSDKFQNRTFLNTRLFNMFKSSPSDVKCKFIDIISEIQ